MLQTRFRGSCNNGSSARLRAGNGNNNVSNNNWNIGGRVQIA